MRFYPMTFLCALTLVLTTAQAQDIFDPNDFTNGAPIEPIEAIGGDVTIDLPPDGIIVASTVTVGAGRTLSFNRNALNTSVYLLATGDIVIEVNGRLSVSGGNGSSTLPGRGGPGGFDGGYPGLQGDDPGAGFGPGGGLAGSNTLPANDETCGAGGHAFSGGAQAKDGNAYGSQLLVPIVGGSGAGGAPNAGGGGGGGAILLVSNTRVVINSGFIFAQGGERSLCDGSGGAVRIVAPAVSGNGTIRVHGGQFSANQASPGRIRIDTIDRSGMNLNFEPLNAPVTIRSYMRLFPDPITHQNPSEPIPRLRIIEVAGQAVDPDSPNPVTITLDPGAPSTQSVVVQAENFTGTVPIEVVVTPEVAGDPIKIDSEIDMGTNPDSVEVTVNNLAPNVVHRVFAWTR